MHNSYFKVPLLVAVLTAGGAALAQVQPVGEEVPARHDPRSAVMLTDAQLWMQVEASGGEVLIGLKAAGARRGVWRGAVLLQGAQRALARQALLEKLGVTLLSEDDVLPRLRVRLHSFEALQRIRRLPVVDYVEPTRVEFLPMSGCTDGNTNGGPNVHEIGPSQSVDGLPRDFGSPPPFDIIPWTFEQAGVPKAWARAKALNGGQDAWKGEGITLGLVDTGIYAEQTQMRPGGFTAGMSGNRTLSYTPTLTDDGDYDTCNHGTRMAGTMAAPRDGVSIVGMAYRANMRIAKSLEDPYYGLGGQSVVPIVEGIRYTVQTGAKVITLAFGSQVWNEAISDEIFHWYYNPSYSVLFLGAAGSGFCPSSAVFPADMDEVISVTGMKDLFTVHPDACGYESTDLGAIIGDDENPAWTTARYNDRVVSIGASSAATGMASALAAMIWSREPWLNRDQVRSKLFASGLGVKRTDLHIGWGAINAYKAFGGFTGLSVTEPSGGSYSAYAQGDPVTFTATPNGDGPFEYTWMNGAKSQAITLTCGLSDLTATATVKDLADGTVFTRSATAHCTPVGDICLTQPWKCPDE